MKQALKEKLERKTLISASKIKKYNSNYAIITIG